MKAFSGFASGKAHLIGVPEPVFTDLVPIIDDLAELKVTLHVLWRLSRQRGGVRYLSYEDLASDEVLLSGLGETPVETLRSALRRAVERGTLIRAELPDGGSEGALYFANSPRGRAAVESVARGEKPQPIESADRPNIFSLYEQNIGLLTPLIAEELREAEDLYPTSWIEQAFREAVSLNKRSWRYIRAILERWRTEGKDDSPGRSAAAERRRYLEWKYGRE